MHTYRKLHTKYAVGMWVHSGKGVSWEDLFEVADLVSAIEAVNCLNGGALHSMPFIHNIIKEIDG